MKKIKLLAVRPHVILYRDSRTGLAWVENGEAGLAHTCHPNIAASGSARGMQRKGYWQKTDKTLLCRGFIYNVSVVSVSDALDELVRQHCQCGGIH